MGSPGTTSLVVSLFALLWVGFAQALEFDARVKAFGTGAALPDHDLQRQLAGTPVYNYSADLRLLFRQQTGPVSWIVDHSTIVNGGDSFGFLLDPGATLDQSPTDDDLRLLDLSWEIDSADRHRSIHRFDRLAIQYRRDNWGVTLGRQAVSWGSGFVFQPMDLFSPFAPTTVDRDYKAGDDLLLVEKLFGDGSDLQLLGVARRDVDGDVRSDVASVALKWHGFVGEGELELFAGKHYRDQVVGVSVRAPLKGALLRTDIVATRLDEGDWKISGILNLDYSLLVANKTTYVFAEYFHNGFGVDELPQSILLLPTDLSLRLARGEVFNLMKDYLAVGASILWHPLWNQSLTLIGNLHDSSTLIQTSVSYEPGDHSRVQIGLVVSLGDAGEEFGGVALLSESATTGGAVQGFLRWVYYF